MEQGHSKQPPRVGFRPPHKGQACVKQLRAEYDEYQRLLDERHFARKVRRFVPVKLNHPIIALRAWDLPDPRGYLTSLAMHYVYDQTIAREVEQVTWHGKKGFWAVKPKSVNILAEYKPPVVGIVELSGKVVEHEFGWRGEVCVMQRLYAIDDNSPWFTNACLNRLVLHTQIREHLSKLYQCDVNTIKSFDTFAAMVSR